MVGLSLRRDFLALKWRLIRHGPNDERGFGLIAGLIVAAAVIALASAANTGYFDRSWLTVGLTVVGMTWVFGPILLPGSSPVLDPQWFRTLPARPRTGALAMASSEAMSVGTVVTAVALTSLFVIASPQGAVAIIVAAGAVVTQLFFLLWLGRCVSILVRQLLRTVQGIWLASVQMSALLAVSFAGWVPALAAVLPGLGEGDVEMNLPSTAVAVPSAIEGLLLSLPTGWGVAAVHAASSAGSINSILLPMVGLLVCGIALRGIWVSLTALTLKQPPARIHSGHIVRRSTLSRRSKADGATWGVTVRESKTWLRDPRRKLGLGHAWMTPLLMILIIAPTAWDWALPFLGVVAALIGAMVAVNTYALDGTALWQLVTTPRALPADVRGRQLAWLLLIGLPILLGTLVLCLVSGSVFWDAALGMTIASVGAAAGAAPLLGALMPAVGADARERVSASDGAGNSAGGEWTIFAGVGAVSCIPVVIVQMAGLGDVPGIHILIGAVCGVAAGIVCGKLAHIYLRRVGAVLVSVFASRDHTRLWTAGRRQ